MVYLRCLAEFQKKKNKSDFIENRYVNFLDYYENMGRPYK